MSTFSYKNIWSIAYPIILGSIAQNVVNITDTAFLGRVGEYELGASAIAGVFYFVIFMIGNGFAIGTQIIVARRNGERKYNLIGRTIDHSFYFLFLFGILMFLFLRFITPEILSKTITSTNILSNASAYLSSRSWGIIFAFINLVFGAFYIGISRTRVISYSFILMAVVNIVLDYVLIFGKLGFSPMGIRGAAVASAISEAVATVFLIIYTFRIIDLKKYGLLYFSKFNKLIFLTTLKISFPVMIQLLISMSAWLIFFILIEKLGEHELAVSNIVRSVYIVLMVPVWGFASAVNTLTSNLMGQKKPNEVMRLISKAILMCIGFELVLTFFNLCFPEIILSVYTPDVNLIRDSFASLNVVNGALLIISPAFILFNGVTGTGKTLTALLIESSVIGMYLIYIYYVTIVNPQTPAIVWTSEFVYAILLGTVSFLYLKFGNWKHHNF